MVITEERKEMLTVAEAAAWLNVSQMTVYRLIKSKRIKAWKLKRNIRIAEEDLRDFIERSSTH